MTADNHCEELSTFELLTRLVGQATTLVRDEAILAVTEIRAKVRSAGLGIGVLGAGAMFGLFGIGALVACAVLALTLVVQPWPAALLVAVVLLSLASVCGLAGLRLLRRGVPPLPQDTVANVRDDVAVVRHAVTR
jgi:hypothetical protein